MLKAQDRKEVPVKKYAKGQSSVANDALNPVGRSQLASDDVESIDGERKATAFDGSIMSKLTPTIKSFTLDGKVAVITGYVGSLLTISSHSVTKGLVS